MTQVLGNITTYQIPKRFYIASQPVDEGGQKKICLPWIVEPLLLWIYVEWHQPCHKKEKEKRAESISTDEFEKQKMVLGNQ